MRFSFLPALLGLAAACSNPMSGLKFACDPDGADSCLPGYVCVRAEAASGFKGICTPDAEVPDAGLADPGPGNDDGLAADLLDLPAPGDLADAPSPVDATDAAPTDTAEVDVCIPACDGRECGPDSCGGLCGQCGTGRVCSGGLCVCNPEDHKACCGNDVCWFDGCGAEGDVTAECADGCLGGKCIGCTPDCTDRECGDDGCGGECGKCAASRCDGLKWWPAQKCESGRCDFVMGGANCDDGVLCTDDFCDPSGGCDHALNSEVCSPERCEDGVHFPEARCQAGACILPKGLDCDDGMACTVDSCSTANGCKHQIDGGYCSIGGQCVPEGQSKTGDVCRVCTVQKDPWDWSPAPDSAWCGTDMECQAGQCVAIVGTCGPNPCPPLAGYGVTCNAQNHCEYAYADPTGWRAWDVWVHVPEGTFGRGCTPATDGWCSDDMPFHDVNLGDYWISKFETTREAFNACIFSGACSSSPGCIWSEAPDGAPANCMNWEQADAVCRSRCPGCRLCTEAEWERAARGTDGRHFPWTANPADCPESWDELCEGPEWTPSTARANCAEEACHDGFANVAPVGSFPSGASPVGALDMIGNVQEWVADWYASDYYCKGPLGTTQGPPWPDCPSGSSPYLSPWEAPLGPLSGAHRVFRGSNYFLQTSFMGTSRRDHGPATDVYGEMHGVRCCR